MGPRTYIRGNMPSARLAQKGLIWLQWGRGLTSAEICRLPSMAPRSLARFNGAADLHPRKCGLAVALSQSSARASMGPRTYIRGNKDNPFSGYSNLVSFNGAADLHPRKSGVHEVVILDSHVLQWGRGLTSAEIHRRSLSLHLLYKA